MKRIQDIPSVVVALVLAAAVGGAAWWLVANRPAKKPIDKPPPSASVGKLVKEEELNTVSLAEKADERIGLTVAPVEKKSVRRVRVYGGEVAVPVGRAIPVAAPLTGFLKAPPGGAVNVGRSVKAGQAVFQLTPLLTPDGRATLSASLAETEGQVNNAAAQVELTRIALERAQRVLKEGAGSQRQVDEAQAASSVAARTFDAAKAREAILKKVVGDAESGTTAAIPITAPVAGILRLVSAQPGQTVPSGAALFEVVDLSTVWVRVSLPVGDFDTIDRDESARVGNLSAPPGTRHPSAKPAAAPPSANPLSATVDVFYEMPNADGKLIPGRRLGVEIPLADPRESLVVPWSALVFDIHGWTWVYEQVGPRRYTRRRVVVAYTVGEDAVLTSGPPVGAKVVTAGILQLFGAETGFVK